MLTKTKRPTSHANDEPALQQFTGTDHYYPHWTRRAMHTDGVQYVAATMGAFWMIDVVVSHQTNPKVRAEHFQVWDFKRSKTTDGITAICTDGNGGDPIVTQRIGFTDFPHGSIRFYFADGVMLLPSEY
jgi:hypothetical protein